MAWAGQTIGSDLVASQRSKVEARNIAVWISIDCDKGEEESLPGRLQQSRGLGAREGRQTLRTAKLE